MLNVSYIPAISMVRQKLHGDVIARYKRMVALMFSTPSAGRLWDAVKMLIKNKPIPNLDR